MRRLLVGMVALLFLLGAQTQTYRQGADSVEVTEEMENIVLLKKMVRIHDSLKRIRRLVEAQESIIYQLKDDVRVLEGRVEELEIANGRI